MASPRRAKYSLARPASPTRVRKRFARPHNSLPAKRLPCSRQNFRRAGHETAPGGCAARGWFDCLPRSVDPVPRVAQAGDERGSTPSAYVVLTSSTDSYTVTDRAGRIVAEVEDGTLVTQGSGVYPILEVGVTEDGQANLVTGTSLWLPTDVYTVENTDWSAAEFEATLIHVNQSATVSTDSSNVTLAVDDSLGMSYARVGDRDSEYYVTLRSSLNVGSGNVEMRGTTSASGISLSQIGGSLYTDACRQAVSSLTVDGRPTDAETLSQQQEDVTDIVPENVAGGMPFRDVSRSDWFFDDVLYVYEHGMMNGTGADIFAPDATTTRAMVVTILYRLDGEPAVTENISFADVPAGQWYSNAINWAAANGIVSGYGNDKFGPDDTFTREQMAAILYRYASFKGYSVSDLANLTGYADAAGVSGWASTAMRWAVAKGLISGTGADTLSPPTMPPALR